MDLEWADQCCDANEYLRVGAECAADLGACWTPLRPLGAGLYFSVPTRLGLPVESLIVLQLLLVLLTGLLVARAIRKLSPTSARWAWWFDALTCTAALLTFLLGAARQALTDVPAACLAISALALWVLSRESVARCALAGLALGLAIFLRSFYLYPALGMAAVVLVLGVARSVRLRGAAAFALAMALPIAVQVGTTYAHTGRLGYIDTRTAQRWENVHFGVPAYGYDTTLPADAQVYPATKCFSHETSMRDAVRNHELVGLACVFAARQYFYFASSGPLHRVYLHGADERTFSLAIFCLHVQAFLLAVLFVARIRKRASCLAPLAFVLAVWAEASVIIPEQRFALVVYCVLWVLAAGGVRVLLAERAAARATARRQAAAAARPSSVPWARL